jgi:hypothetical protein
MLKDNLIILRKMHGLRKKLRRKSVFPDRLMLSGKVELRFRILKKAVVLLRCMALPLTV